MKMDHLATIRMDDLETFFEKHIPFADTENLVNAFDVIQN